MAKRTQALLLLDKGSPMRLQPGVWRCASAMDAHGRTGSSRKSWPACVGSPTAEAHAGRVGEAPGGYRGARRRGLRPLRGGTPVPRVSASGPAPCVLVVALACEAHLDGGPLV